MKKLKVVVVLQYNGVNMKVISTKRTTVKMGLLHQNTPVDFHFWVYELLMSLKTRGHVTSVYLHPPPSESCA